MNAAEASIMRPPNHCDVVSLLPKRTSERSTEVTGSIRLINEALEGPILEMPMKNPVSAMTVHTAVMIITQNHAAISQFKWIKPVNVPVIPKLTVPAPITKKTATSPLTLLRTRSA